MRDYKGTDEKRRKEGPSLIIMESIHHIGEGSRIGRKKGEPLLIEPETHGLSQFKYLNG
jgi:hypothetical protein